MLVFDNILTNNVRYGIDLHGGRWNTIFRNNLIDNLMINALDEFGSNNQWDNGSVGNYWSDWTTPDVQYFWCNCCTCMAKI